MKCKMPLLASVLVMAICMASSAFAASAVNPTISVQILKYEPYPAEPGKYFDLWINIENSGLGSADKFTFMLDPKYPFSLDSSENATRYFGSIESSSNIIIKYKVRIAPDAVEGFNEIKYQYKYGTDGFWISNNLSIYVQTPDAIIAIDNVKTTPSQMAPGKSSALEITLENMADSSLKDVSIKLDLSALSFYPTGTATEQKAYLMVSREKKAFVFNLMAGPSLAAGVYKIPMNISYYDLTGTSYSKIDYATVVVGDAPEIVTGIESTTILKAGESGKVVLKIINTGLTGLKLLSVSLENSENYAILSPSSSLYIGSLDSDGYETAEYSIYVKPDVQGNLILPVTLEYRDDNNNQFTESRQIELRLYSQDDIIKYGLRMEGGMALWIIILVLVIVAYLVYGKFFKKKNGRR